MRAVASFRRHILFGVVSLALLAAAFAIGSEGGAPASPSDAEGSGAAAIPVPAAASRLTAHVARLLVSVKPPARLFLRAFFRYEVGDLGPGVAGALRASATPSFARQLLAAPPRPMAAGSYQLPARLGPLEAAVVAPDASRVVVSGEAHRGPASEQFSFVFVHAPGGWLASGPGQ